MPVAETPDRLDRFYRLLPAVHRLRDDERGKPLRALLQVIAGEAALLEDDIAQLYDNWFIETAQDWVVPYIADLIGHDPIDAAVGDSQITDPWLLPRREIANTLRYRRRKGTLALLELLAGDVAGWPARAVEFVRLLAQSQSARLPVLARGRSVDLRDGLALAGLGSAFDELAHTIDVRRPLSARAQGRYGPIGVGLFVWRLRAYPVTCTPAYCLEDIHPYCYAFSVLGNDAPLFNRPLPEADPHRIAGPRNLPLPIGRRAFAAEAEHGAAFATASPDYYAPIAGSRGAQSVLVWAPGWPNPRSPQPIPASQVIPADLDDWSYAPPRGHIAVDPERGRIAFPPRQLCKGPVSVSYHYGFSADIGGGEYTRPLRQAASAEFIFVNSVDELRRALLRWRREYDADGNVVATPDQPEHGVIEIGQSGVYTLPLTIYLGAGHSLQLRAGQRTRPVLRLLDWQADQTDSLWVSGGEGSRFTLDGVMLAGRGTMIEGDLASFTVRHCTLVPGWSLEPDCDPKRPAEASIEVINSRACIVIAHSIVGSIQVNNDEVTTDPLRILISDSVLDATGADCDSPQCEAIGAQGSLHAFATLQIARSTVIGRVMVHAVERADDSIFMGRMTVARRQHGCIRFCYISPQSRTPRRYECQPDLAEHAAGNDEAARQAAIARVRPRFDSTRYGTPTYCRLSPDCAEEILRGAEDQSEMGVFHDLQGPRRTANLRARLEEFTPANADASIIFAD